MNHFMVPSTLLKIKNLWAYIICRVNQQLKKCHEGVMKPNSFACGHNARSRDSQERATGVLPASSQCSRPGIVNHPPARAIITGARHTLASGDSIFFRGADCCIIHRLWMWTPRASFDDELAVELNIRVGVFQVLNWEEKLNSLDQLPCPMRYMYSAVTSSTRRTISGRYHGKIHATLPQAVDMPEDSLIERCRLYS